MSFSFDSLGSADLIVDSVYEGGSLGHSGDEPLAPLLSVKISGGVRYRGSARRPTLVVLTTSGRDPDWPDSLDEESGVFTYYGDNRTPGQELHSTPIRGNEVLMHLFAAAANKHSRRRVPPVLVFASTGEGRSKRFLGLAVPGTRGSAPSEELVAIWRSTNGRRYQNYRAAFTILDVPVIRRSWLDEILRGDEARDVHAPPAWLRWVDTGVPQPLTAPRTRETRTAREQQPATAAEQAMLSSIWRYFSQRPHDFEHFAAHLIELYLPQVSAVEVTRPSKDGGRDGVGKYRLGAGASGIELDFAMEAKCYAPGNGVGVRDISRLLSRLRHRQFGILVTTSHLDRQAYFELKEDRHPVIVIAGRDVVEILLGVGATNNGPVESYLDSVVRG
ncbi:MAG: restriction endonuclease [Microbacterium sp.]|uniref:restriction endonuclease n=1 Tax=Microbacterium sp. TaxID=51671 RepID=UPI003D6DF9A6